MSIRVNQLVIKNHIDDRFLVKDLSFLVSTNDKLAIIGEEGSGKSTLLKVLHDRFSTSYVTVTGDIIKKGCSGYLEQDIKNRWGSFKTIDYLLSDLKDGLDIDHDFSHLEKLSLLTKYLKKVNFNLDRFDEDKLINQYSGGEIIKLGLVKLLINDIDILLLDEPSNDLDFEGINFLIDFINNSKIPIIFISHDQYLLTHTATAIIHLFINKKNGEVISTYANLDYQDYCQTRLHQRQKDLKVGLKQRANHQEKLDAWHKIYQKVKHQQDQAVRDPGLGKKLKVKMRNLISVNQRFEKTATTFVDIPPKDEFIELFFDDDIYIPNNKVVCNYICQELRNNQILLASNIELNIVGPTHLVIVGNNGVGKTTLLKELVNHIASIDQIIVGYMPQDYLSVIDDYQIALDFLLPNHDRNQEPMIRKMMGSALFTREEMISPIKNLSGGSIAKLFILKMIIDKCNVLILDEPTRNISPLNASQIYQILNEFKGTIISVSHDQTYIDETADLMYQLTPNGLKNIK